MAICLAVKMGLNRLDSHEQDLPNADLLEQIVTEADAAVELLAISSSCSSSQHASSLWGLFLPTMQRRHWLDASYDA
ncbi:uncharacterized protein UMAG_04307 [Mycosarcoma maydis]|uniref:Uncharacterized protein n=1 Tax=Mycosarcoma maydis TaxID=5270 RepID=A0A0D1CM47_MYCMD|nr:uncharacterized protein UMAG_04307 [Ustilago maydis 521]KIS67813.1 hypothetical protein UMAG_04307 [Ustilago maydis 521]|eukprot:XP_011390758.1 hypothetical protein UMAG_04307 [Ustilago maydis 521]